MLQTIRTCKQSVFGDLQNKTLVVFDQDLRALFQQKCIHVKFI